MKTFEVTIQYQMEPCDCDFERKSASEQESLYEKGLSDILRHVGFQTVSHTSGGVFKVVPYIGQPVEKKN
jgi:hypothetical protein